MDMELCITGPEPGKIDHTLYCHVMNLVEPLHLQSYYYLKCFRPGMAMDMELCITGPEPGKIDHTLYCHVMNLEEPHHLQSYYYL